MIRLSQDNGTSTNLSANPPQHATVQDSTVQDSTVQGAKASNSRHENNLPHPTSSPRWSWRKSFGSLLIAIHLLAIAIAPASVPPTSATVQNGWLLLQPYLQLAFLNHGYHYFAPDPGPSSLIEYTVVTQDGDRIWGRIPDRKTIWPRLLYHRHFMLTEFYGGLPPAAGEMKQVVAQSYAQQLMHQHQGVSVELAHVVHQLSSRQEVLEGGHLDDPHKYEITPLGTFSLQTVEHAAAPVTAETASPTPPPIELAPMPVSELNRSAEGFFDQKATE
jgi:hypothetical protein